MGDDGTFVLHGLFGPRVIRVNPIEGFSVERVTLGGEDITDHPVEFKRGATSRIQVHVSRRPGAEIAGIVTDRSGKLSELAMVIAFGEDPSRWFSQATTTRLVSARPDGPYRLQRLRPGSYYVVAVIASAWPALYDAPREVFEKLAKLASIVTIGDGERRTLDLTIAEDRER